MKSEDERIMQILDSLAFANDETMTFDKVYEAKAQIKSLLREARLDEMKLAHKAWLTSSLVDHMENRIAELKEQPDG